MSYTGLQNCGERYKNIILVFNFINKNYLNIIWGLSNDRVISLTLSNFDQTSIVFGYLGPKWWLIFFKFLSRYLISNITKIKINMDILKADEYFFYNHSFKVNTFIIVRKIFNFLAYFFEVCKLQFYKKRGQVWKWRSFLNLRIKMDTFIIVLDEKNSFFFNFSIILNFLCVLKYYKNEDKHENLSNYNY